MTAAKKKPAVKSTVKAEKKVAKAPEKQSKAEMIKELEGMKTLNSTRAKQLVVDLLK